VLVKPNFVTRGGHEQAVAHFVKSIQTDCPPEASGEHGLALMKIIDALYASAELGREVAV
jgi:predicted dehydrogenase